MMRPVHRGSTGDSWASEPRTLQTTLRWAALLLAVAVCLHATPARLHAQVPFEILELSPNLKGLGGDVAARWIVIDLTEAEGPPLVGNSSYGINAADFDNDGDLDLVVAFQKGGEKIPDGDEEYGLVYWLENVTPRQASGAAFIVHPLDDKQVTPKDAVVLGPMADGRRAAVIPCYLSGETILYETSDGEEWNKVSLRSEGLEAPVRAVVADIDGNGTDDIVVTSIAESGIHVAWFRRGARGSSAWEDVPIRVELPPIIGVDAGDVDGDGDLDLVCASEHSPTPFLLRNEDGKGMEWKAEPLAVSTPDSVETWVARFSDLPVSQVHVLLRDVDEDGDLDCIETSLRNGYLAWRENTGSSKPWTFHIIAGGLGHAYSFDTGDVDRDGHTDLVVPSDGGDGVYVFRNVRGDGMEWEAIRLGDGADLNWPNIVRLADVNGDGNEDILATDWGPRAVVWINPFGAQTGK